MISSTFKTYLLGEHFTTPINYNEESSMFFHLFTLSPPLWSSEQGNRKPLFSWYMGALRWNRHLSDVSVFLDMYFRAHVGTGNIITVTHRKAVSGNPIRHANSNPACEFLPSKACGKHHSDGRTDQGKKQLLWRAMGYLAGEGLY